MYYDEYQGGATSIPGYNFVPNNQYTSPGSPTNANVSPTTTETPQNPLEDIPWEDIVAQSSSSSRSYSGLPDYFTKWAQEWWPQYTQFGGQQIKKWEDLIGDRSGLNRYKAGDLASLQQNLGRMRSDFMGNTAGMENYIEQARKLMPQQYAATMQDDLQRNIQSQLNRMSGRGILDSSVTGGALSDVIRARDARLSDMTKAADLWASQQGYDLKKYLSDTLLGINRFGTEQEGGLNRYFTEANIGQDREQRQGYLDSVDRLQNLLPQLLNAFKYSESEGMGENYGGLLPLLLAMYE
jgi:hypothetical protein